VNDIRSRNDIVVAQYGFFYNINDELDDYS